MLDLFSKSKTTILSEGNVCISNKVVTVGNAAFPIRNVSSFGQAKIPNQWRWLMLIAGGIMTFATISQIAYKPTPTIIGLIIIGVSFLIPTKYGIRIESNSGISRYIVSTDISFINRMLLALYKAANSSLNAEEMVTFQIGNATFKTGDIYKDISNSQIFVRNNTVPED